MSVAARRSSQGDEYQLRVALHWLIELLAGADVTELLVEAVALPPEQQADGADTVAASQGGQKVHVDDIVVTFRDGHRLYIQAKKNQPEFNGWRLSDPELKGELRKARDQLEGDPTGRVRFYSRSPFGELEHLVDACRLHPDFFAFRGMAGREAMALLTRFGESLERPLDATFLLAQRIEFGPHHRFEDWDKQNLRALSLLMPRATNGLPVLERFLGSHQTGLRNSRWVILRDDVVQELYRHDLVLAAPRELTSVLDAFARASAIGRSWLREISGRRIPRPELAGLLTAIESGARTVLVVDRPGSGKTCLLLDLADEVEARPAWALLFLKGDHFTQAATEAELAGMGLPEDLVGMAARLGMERRVVVVIDSLDVLSLQRDHRALRLFLGLMDRLQRVNGVTVVAACRSFDLDHDPLLRGRNWEHRLELEDLDFDTVVAPLLADLGVDIAGLGREVKELLGLPHQLRLFVRLAERGRPPAATTAFELMEEYLQELVLSDPELGTPAIEALEQLAARMVEEKTLQLPAAAFRGDDRRFRRLVSLEVLRPDPPGQVGFSHQTLLDGLLGRGALAEGTDLATFILARPQLPFLRPTVRAFVSTLRAFAPASFVRQVRAAVGHHDVAYHLKRAIVETFAEMSPAEGDWQLVRLLFQSDPDLFQRWLFKATAPSWLRVLEQEWLPLLQDDAESRPWRERFVWRLQVWLADQPEAVIALYQRALDEGWSERTRLATDITFSLRGMKSWEAAGIPELLAALVETCADGQTTLGHVVSRYVAAADTGTGDDLLWRYIISDIEEAQPSTDHLARKLRCEKHRFQPGTFLCDRFAASDHLLDLAVEAITRWDAPESGGGLGLSTALLYHSSWDESHSRHDISPPDALSTLLDSVQHAIAIRSSARSPWWVSNEPALRNSHSGALRYFLIMAYRSSAPEENPDGIASQLSDDELLRYGKLQHELGELTRISYHTLPVEIIERHQQTVLGLYAEEREASGVLDRWTAREIYHYLLWIPRPFRGTAAMAFLDQWSHEFGESRPEPEFHSWSGTVLPPVSLEVLLQLPKSDLLRLFRDCPVRESFVGDQVPGGFLGGRHELCGVLAEASCRDPVRFLSLLPSFVEEGLSPDFFLAVMSGVAQHLEPQTKTQLPQSELGVGPAPVRERLAAQLVDLLERWPHPWTSPRDAAGILSTCASELVESADIERVVFLLFRLLRASGPEEDQQVTSNAGQPRKMQASDLVRIAINSTRGRAAEAATVLANRLVTEGKPFPELLPGLLGHFVSDPILSVRTAVLRHLPALMHRNPDLGWNLFARAFREPQQLLWAHGERCLYYQYHAHFDRVAPYLDRIREEAGDLAGKIWGRIATLSCLAGHLSMDLLFQEMAGFPTNDVYEAAADVFSANLASAASRTSCRQGLTELLHRLPSREVLVKIDRAFHAAKEAGVGIDVGFASTFLLAWFQSGNATEPRHFYEWLGMLSRRDASTARCLLELLADRLVQGATQPSIHSEPIVDAIVEVLRDADQSDDPDQIHRAIALQDKFLRLNLYGMEKMLERA